MWERLTKFFNNAEAKVTADKYFEICEQMGTEPDPQKIPVEWKDLPNIVQISISIFNMLGDRLVADALFVNMNLFFADRVYYLTKIVVSYF